MACLSPNDYIRAAGGKRNEASRLLVAAKPQLSGPIVAYDTVNLSDPVLLEMMRGGRTGVAGVAITERKALRNSTLFRAMSLIAGSMGMLPLHLMRRKADGRTEKAKDHPLFNVLHRKANSYQTASQFKS